jgi:hypothetical protein
MDNESLSGRKIFRAGIKKTPTVVSVLHPISIYYLLILMVENFSSPVLMLKK